MQNNIENLQKIHLAVRIFLLEYLKKDDIISWKILKYHRTHLEI